VAGVGVVVRADLSMQGKCKHALRRSDIKKITAHRNSGLIRIRLFGLPSRARRWRTGRIHGTIEPCHQKPIGILRERSTDSEIRRCIMSPQEILELLKIVTLVMSPWYNKWVDNFKKKKRNKK
jgi:hypothetical protein